MQDQGTCLLACRPGHGLSSSWTAYDREAQKRTNLFFFLAQGPPVHHLVLSPNEVILMVILLSILIALD